MDYTQGYISPLGCITLASDGEALVGLWFDGQRHFADTLDARHEERCIPVLREAMKWLDVYFSGRDPGFTPSLRLRPSAFRKAVWNIMLDIPFGMAMTYGEIAATLARQQGISRMSAQAVGNAVGHNAISLIIPCHRVLGAGGALTGYAGGLDRKQRLLELEKNA